MADQPKLSVIIPTVGSDALPEIVKVFLESPVAAEVIVVVDKPDADMQALEEMARRNSALRIIRNEINLGVTRSLNKAIAASHGEIIVRNDDDDLPHPQRLEKTQAFFDTNPACDMGFAFATGRDEASGREWLIDSPLDDLEIKKKLQERNFIVHSTLAFRKSVLAKIDFYDPTFRYAQDYDMYLRATHAGLTFGVIPEPLVTRVYHDQSITVSRRHRQILFSFAARLIHLAESAEPMNIWPTIRTYLKLLLVPNSLRQLRRRLGRGR
ncbi:MAG: glycosyltransferase family 2 protein [Beijerinckiaceae bacterium]